MRKKRTSWNKGLHIALKPRTGKILVCPVCKGEFYRQKSTARVNACCSVKCKGIKQRKKWYNFICKRCGNQFRKNQSILKWAKIRKTRILFCSISCYKLYKKTKFCMKKQKTKNKPMLLKKELWMIFSKYIRQRDQGICFSCGKKDFWRRMDAGHYIPKTAGLALYFDERNVNCQCTYCNRYMHGNLAKYAIALRKKYGETILEDLDKERYKIKVIKSIEYQNLIEYYKNKLLENNFI